MTSLKLFWLYRRNISDLLYVVLRRIICPFNTMEKIVRHGPIGLLADIGCGHGLFSLYCALRGHKIIGFEPVENRVIRAERARNGKKSVLFVRGFFSTKKHSVQAAFLSDVLHHCTLSDQRLLLKQVRESLVDGGILVIKEICTDDGLSYRLSALCDALLYPREQCCFHSRKELTDQLISSGYTVTVINKSFLLSTNLFVARR
jgi:SAM-dependent methyltransferase